ncbi:FAD-dependent pyridine nucleotide-disulfide oxidoreductase [bacterium]|nr:MAG: FAD-dependent pyridine nucleotide-disulfide oxidoreductase [bacterium]
MSKHLVLLGGGHANLHVLEALAHDPLEDCKVTLVSPWCGQIYSGMLPGWVAGHYRLDECQIPLDQLAAAAGADFLHTPACSIDANHRRICLGGGNTISYDVLAVDIGSAIRTDAILCEPEYVVPVRPAQLFAERYRRFVCTGDSGPIAVVGGGMGSVELACALRAGLGQGIEITAFVGRSGLVPSHPRPLRARLLHTLQNRDVAVITDEVRRVDATHVETRAGRRFPTSFVVLATGPQAPHLLHGSGLKLDSAGYLKVDACLRSLSHPDVLAAGDCASLPFDKITRSGVYAVRQGSVLARNIRAVMTTGVLHRFRPQRRALYLISTGTRHAIGTWGPWSFQGEWVWKWKDLIDRQFVRRFSAY